VLTVHIRINDDSTGQPTPVRLRISNSQGQSFEPLGYPAVFPIGVGESLGCYSRVAKENWYVVSGSFEIKLPAQEELRIQAYKGPEHVPIDERITLAPGKISARFSIKRWSNLADKGWLSGDSRCHFMNAHDALVEAEAEDISIVNLLVREHPVMSQDGHLYPIAQSINSFSGQSELVRRSDHAVVVNTLNSHPALGRLGLLNSHRPVYPLSFGEFNDDWSLLDWCSQCHRKKGLTIWTDPFQPQSGVLGGEAIVAAVLGHIDAFEFDPKPRTQPILPWFYRLWNAGFTLPLVAGSAKDSNTVSLGSMRTYAQVAERTYAQWIEAVRTGKTFITNGPLIDFECKASDANLEQVTLGRYSLHAKAESVANFDELQIISNGSPIAHATSKLNSETGRYQAEIHMETEPESGWLAARVIGQSASFLYSQMPIFAHTSPVKVDNLNKPYNNRRAHLPLLRKCAEDTQRWIEEYGRFTDQKHKKHLLEHCTHAMLKLLD
jgi:hypothetical protein